MRSITVLTLLALFLSASAALGQSTQATASVPADPEVLVRVGDAELTSAQVDEILQQAPADLPADRLEAFRQQIIDQFIQRELMFAYLDSLPTPQEKVEEKKAELSQQ